MNLRVFALILSAGTGAARGLAQSSTVDQAAWHHVPRGSAASGAFRAGAMRFCRRGKPANERSAECMRPGSSALGGHRRPREPHSTTTRTAFRASSNGPGHATVTEKGPLNEPCLSDLLPIPLSGARFAAWTPVAFRPVFRSFRESFPTMVRARATWSRYVGLRASFASSAAGAVSHTASRAGRGCYVAATVRQMLL